MANIEVPLLRVRQNIGDVYVGAMKARDLFEIATSDRIRLESLRVPKYAGYQRPLVGERVSEIKDYLNTPRGTFPNSIILNLDSEYVEEWNDISPPQLKKLTELTIMNIRREPGAARIIDGQHRVAALESAPERFLVIVSIFLDLTTAEAAEIFAKINSTQRAVNPSIAFQLFGYFSERSPQRTAHHVAEVLNEKEGSPFYRGLRMLGTKDAWSRGVLSQSTFAKELMKFYTKDHIEDENLLLRGETLSMYDGRHPLRGAFIEGQEKQILNAVWRGFAAVARTWPDQWSDPSGTSVLTKTTGFSAFMAVLRRWLSARGEQVPGNQWGEQLTGIQRRYERPEMRFTRENYPAGNQGVIKLRNLLLEDLELS